MDLTVEFTVLAPATKGELVAPLPICDRCRDPGEIVVATMKILLVEQVWSLCGSCVREMPRGYHLA